MMYVTVRYYKPQLSGYAGMAYTYRTSLPLKAGDKVIAPTKGGDNRAIVLDADVPENSIAPHILPLLREITQYDTEEEKV
nr:MAG TPA: Protein of unknown function (DUF2577) [Caudoviricetes sp.]